MTSSIDIDHLNQYIGGDEALRDEILTIFDEQACLWVNRLDPVQDDGDWRDAAHALKGASRGIGAWSVGDLCEEAEGLVAGTPEKVARRREILGRIAECVSLTLREARLLRNGA